METQGVIVTPVWIEYREWNILISNEIFVPKGTILPFKQGVITVVAGAVEDKQFPPGALKPLKMTVQGERLPEDLILATANLRKHLQVLKETGMIRFLFRTDGSLSVSIEESLHLAG